jgi:hypothetical protein
MLPINARQVGSIDGNIPAFVTVCTGRSLLTYDSAT